MFFTYVLKSTITGQYYIGSSKNPIKRLRKHNSGQSKATKSGRPWKFQYLKVFSTRSEAYKHELYIKKQKSRAYINKISNIT